MGYKIAARALARGHRVTLISGPVKITPPRVQRLILIETSEDLLRALKKEIKKTDCLIMCAAVGDFKARKISGKKIKRKNNLLVNLKANKDILRELARHKKHNLFVGFNLETENLVRNAEKKLKTKNLDIMVANRLTKYHNPFGDNNLDVVIIDRFGKNANLKAKDKGFIANVLLDKIEELWYLKRKGKL